MYSSKEGIEQFVFKELLLFHFPFGGEYLRDEVVEYEESLPNMFGGDPIQGDGKIFFKSVDFDKKHCVMINQLKLNPDDAKTMLLGIIKRLGVQDEEFDSFVEEAQFDIIDNNYFEYYYNPGIPVKIETQRESIFKVMSESGKRVEKTIIEWMDD